jgi:hypothetical protein
MLGGRASIVESWIPALSIEVAALEQQNPLLSILDGTEKEFRLAMDDIKKIIDAEKGRLSD